MTKSPFGQVPKAYFGYQQRAPGLAIFTVAITCCCVSAGCESMYWWSPTVAFPPRIGPGVSYFRGEIVRSLLPKTRASMEYAPGPNTAKITQ